MKNRKGQTGMLIGVAMAVIIGLVLFQAIAANVEQGTRAISGTSLAANTTMTGTIGTVVELTGQELVSIIEVTNRSDGSVIPSTNYTFAECVRTSDNLKGICYTQKAGWWSAKGVNVSYAYYPNGYIDDSGARGITGIIVLLTAIAIILVVLAGSKFDF